MVTEIYFCVCYCFYVLRQIFQTNSNRKDFVWHCKYTPCSQWTGKWTLRQLFLLQMSQFPIQTHFNWHFCCNTSLPGTTPAWLGWNGTDMVVDTKLLCPWSWINSLILNLQENFMCLRLLKLTSLVIWMRNYLSYMYKHLHTKFHVLLFLINLYHSEGTDLQQNIYLYRQLHGVVVNWSEGQFYPSHLHLSIFKWKKY